MRLFIPGSFALLSVFLFLFPSVADGDVWTVRADGTGDAPTIQAAIDSASAGDVVELEDGVYTGEGNRDITFLGKEITLRSASDDPEACVVDCYLEHYPTRRGFLFVSGEGSGTLLRGITVTRGYVRPEEANPRGGAILIDGASPVIENCRILDNYAKFGGGIFARGGETVTIAGCEIAGNGDSEEGGGIWAGDGIELLMTDCMFSGNGSSGFGGGMELNGASGDITRCRFIENAASWHGGGIRSFFSDCRFKECEMRGNSALVGGGIVVYNVDERSDVATIEDCSITGNKAWDGGGILLGGDVDAILAGTTISGNNARLTGGGLYLDTDSPAILERCVVYGNCSEDASTDQIYMNVSALAEFSCCCVDSAGVGGSGTVTWVSENLFTDPLFCDPADCAEAPTVEGDYTLQSGSPCLDHPVCGRIGAYGEGCSGPAAVENTSWGGVKRLFR